MGVLWLILASWVVLSLVCAPVIGVLLRRTSPGVAAGAVADAVVEALPVANDEPITGVA